VKTKIAPVWKKVTPELEQELVAFWRDNNAIVDEASAKQRAAQVVCVVRDKVGALCGVVTAAVKVLPRLRQPMYYYRMFFARTLRGQQQFLPTFQRAKQILQDYNAKLDKPESLGLLLELENEKLGKAYPHACEPDFDAIFIGYSPRGLQLRVSYFENAILQPPVPIRSVGAKRGTVAS
jgi:hypothetical protein